MKTLIKFIAILCIAVALPLNSYAVAPVFKLQLALASKDLGVSKKDTCKELTSSLRSILGISRNFAVNLDAGLYTRAYNGFSQWESDGLLLEAIYIFLPTARFGKPTYLIGARHEPVLFDDSKRDFRRTSLIKNGWPV